MSAAGFRSTCKEAFVVNTEAGGRGFTHKGERAKRTTAWLQATINGEPTQQVNATKRAHDEPVSFLTADWTSLVREFEVQRGKLEDEERPSECSYEAFEEGFHDGILEAKTLAYVVSLPDAKKQRASRPEPAKQQGLHLDSTLTVGHRCLLSLTASILASSGMQVAQLPRFVMRVFLMPMPSKNYTSCRKAELSYATGYSRNTRRITDHVTGHTTAHSYHGTYAQFKFASSSSYASARLGRFQQLARLWKHGFWRQH